MTQAPGRQVELWIVLLSVKSKTKEGKGLQIVWILILLLILVVSYNIDFRWYKGIKPKYNTI